MTLWYLLISVCVIFTISTQSLMCSHQTTSAYYIFFFMFSNRSDAVLSSDTPDRQQVYESDSAACQITDNAAL